MFKLICVFVFYFAVGYAVDKKGEITWGRLSKGRDYPGVTIQSSETKTDITWNEPVSDKINPLRATFNVNFNKERKSKSTNLENLCGNYKKGSFDHVNQLYILQTIANVENCPIKKGAKATFSVPKTVHYSINKSVGCGSFRAEFKVYKKSDTGNSQPIMTNTVRGNVTGC